MMALMFGFHAGGGFGKNGNQIRFGLQRDHLDNWNGDILFQQRVGGWDRKATSPARQVDEPQVFALGKNVLVRTISECLN